MPQPVYPWERDLIIPIVMEAGWATGSVWTGVKNFAFTGIRFPDHPARSKSYKLHCLGLQHNAIIYCL